jgi:hypothetical protein
MPKIFLIFPAMVLLSAGASAQTSVEFIPTGGYTFANHTDYYNSYSRIADGPSYGGSINFNFTRGFGLEVLYSHMNTTIGDYNYGVSQTPIDGLSRLNFDYVMGGPVTSFTIANSTMRPFLGALFGAAILTPDGYVGTSETHFAAGFQLGTNIYFSPHVGLQLKAQMLSLVEGAGGSIYLSNYGAGVGVDTYSSIYQFSVSGGLIIGLGKVLGAERYHPGHARSHYRYY